jgi:hypothetical protein
MVVRGRMIFFWVMAPCRLVGRCQRFGGTYCLNLQPLDVLSLSSGLKMETVCFSEMVASTDKSAWRQNPEEHYYNEIRC